MKKLLIRGVAAVCMSATLFASSINPSTADDTDVVEALVANYEHVRPGFVAEQNVMPQALDGSIDLGPIEIEVGASKKVVRHTGWIDYGTTDQGHHVVAASDGPGTERFGLVIEQGGPSRVALPVVLPSDATIEHTPTGAVVIEAADQRTELAPAAAVDLAGQRIDASYRVEGDSLIVSVDLESATGPVLVDPSVSAVRWWGTTQWFSKNYVRAYGDAYGAVKVARAICNGARFATALCNATVGRYTGWIANTWADAKRYGQCVEMSMTWTGQVTSVSRYNCSWW